MTSEKPSPFTSRLSPPKRRNWRRLGCPRWSRLERGRGRRRTVVRETTTFVDLTVGEIRCTDDDVREAVSIDVTRGAHGATEGGVGLVAFRDPCRRCGRARPRAQVDERSSLVGLAVVVVKAPTMTSAKPSPFTSPEVPTESPKPALAWSHSAIHAGDAASPAAEPR